jgi:hypothetical protein
MASMSGSSGEPTPLASNKRQSKGNSYGGAEGRGIWLTLVQYRAGPSNFHGMAVSANSITTLLGLDRERGHVGDGEGSTGQG